MNHIKNMSFSWSIGTHDIGSFSERKSEFIDTSECCKGNWRKHNNIYSPIMIPPRTIWWAAFFWFEQARSLSASSELFTSSSLSESEASPLREIWFTWVVSVMESESKESSTLEISSSEEDSSEVSLARWLICACVSDIF